MLKKANIKVGETKTVITVCLFHDNGWEIVVGNKLSLLFCLMVSSTTVPAGPGPRT